MLSHAPGRVQHDNIRCVPFNSVRVLQCNPQCGPRFLATPHATTPRWPATVSWRWHFMDQRLPIQSLRRFVASWLPHDSETVSDTWTREASGSKRRWCSRVLKSATSQTSQTSACSLPLKKGLRHLHACTAFHAFHAFCILNWKKSDSRPNLESFHAAVPKKHQPQCEELSKVPRTRHDGCSWVSGHWRRTWFCSFTRKENTYDSSLVLTRAVKYHAHSHQCFHSLLSPVQRFQNFMGQMKDIVAEATPSWRRAAWGAEAGRLGFLEAFSSPGWLGVRF